MVSRTSRAAIGMPGVSIPWAFSLRDIKIPISFGSIGLVLSVIDLILILALSAVTAAIYDVSVFGSHNDVAWSGTIGSFCALLFVLSMQAQHLYRSSMILHPSRIVVSVFYTWTAVFGAVLVVGFLAKVSDEFSRGASILFYLAGAAFLPLSRVAAKKTFSALIANDMLSWRRNVVLVGDKEELSAAGLAHGLARHGYDVVEHFAVARSGVALGIYREIATMLEMLREYVQEHTVDEIFLVFPNTDQRSIDIVSEYLKSVPLPVRLLFDKKVDRYLTNPIADLGAARAVKLQSGPLSFAQQIYKRAFDAVLAAIGLVVMAPMFVLIAFAIRLDSPGPVLFRQRRTGFGGRVFSIYKFRSMTALDDGAVVKQATRGDMRVTRVGRFLRKTSLDEIPQLLNVLQGDMSLVGPRPHALSHDDEYTKLISTYALRHHMKPGITGWAQVNGCRGETSSLGAMEARVGHDIWYIVHWSPLLDIKAIVLTVSQVFSLKNVY